MWHVLGRLELYNTFVVGKPEGERPLGNPKCRCRGKSCNRLKEIRFVGVGWISSVHDKDK
jgi:hypothetical protein